MPMTLVALQTLANEGKVRKLKRGRGIRYELWGARAFVEKPEPKTAHAHGPLRAFESKYNISTTEFLRDFRLRERIAHDDVFAWEVEAWRSRLLRKVYETRPPVVNQGWVRVRVSGKKEALRRLRG